MANTNSTTFVTSDGIKGRTQSNRRFVVVHTWDPRDGRPIKVVIDYRTDDIGRAQAYANKHSRFGCEVIDTAPPVGQLVRVVYPPAAVALAGARPAYS